MKIKNLITFALTAIVMVLCELATSAQKPTVTASPTINTSGYRTTPTQVGEQDERVNKIIAQAETLFYEGALHLRDKQYAQAREKFDKAVEVILMSGFSVRAFPKLNAYYAELVDKIYKYEVPTTPTAQPSVKSTDAVVAVASVVEQQISPQVGFIDQKFEASPLEELAKLELATEVVIQNLERPRKVSPKSNICETADFPTIQNLRLGMAFQTVSQSGGLNFKTAKITKEVTGETSYRFIAPRKGVAFLILTFYENQLYSMGVYYDHSIEWRDLTEFKNYVAKALSIDANWTADSDYYPRLFMRRCKNFVLSVSNYGYTGKVLIAFDRSISNKIQEKKVEMVRQQEAAKQRRKETFKP